MVIPYTPRTQFRALHDSTSRWAIVVAHRRAGKTVACINHLIRAALSCERPAGRFFYLAPFFVQAKDVAWGYLLEFSAAIPGIKVNASELWVEYPNGARVRLYGADNIDRMRGLYFDGGVLDEVADMDARVWGEVIRPTLADREGWAIFIGTPKGPNQFAEMWKEAQRQPGWLALMLRASETGILPQHELDELRASMSEDQYAQEMECSFDAAVKGAYYARQLERMRAEGRICRVPPDPFLPVHTSWDLGMRDQTAIWLLQRVGTETRGVGYYAASSVGLDHYVQWLTDWLRQYDGLRWGRHYLPHDVQVKELTSGRSRLQTLHALGLKDVMVVPAHSPLDGVNTVRRLLDRMWIDGEACEEGLRCLQLYRSAIDEKTGAFLPRPVHDQYSHGADALRYFAAMMDDRSVPSTKAWDAYFGRDKRASKGSWMSA